MCTQKTEINVKSPQDTKSLWKMPEQLSGVFLKGGTPKMLVKCGKCYECKKERARNWTYKLWLEAMETKEKCFITLTYRSNNKGKNLSKRDLTLFIKKLRKHIDKSENKKIKYFAAGEYGEKKGRSHYHIIILGWKPKDLKEMQSKSGKGKNLYDSQTIYDIWGMGRITVQPFAKNEIGYLTLYIGNNDNLERGLNEKQLKSHKHKITLLKEKYGILHKYRHPKGEIQWLKVKNVKDLTKDQLKLYKKELNIITLDTQSKLKKQMEFNLWSQGIGFEKYIKNEYWRYDLKIDDYTYERPKEYLRKIWENAEKYKDEINLYNINELLKRKKHAEENYIEPSDKAAVKKEKAKERRQITKNFESIKLHKKTESIF